MAGGDTSCRWLGTLGLQTAERELRGKANDQSQNQSDAGVASSHWKTPTKESDGKQQYIQENQEVEAVEYEQTRWTGGDGPEGQHMKDGQKRADEEDDEHQEELQEDDESALHGRCLSV